MADPLTFLLLPGLHGMGDLFTAFENCCPAGWRTQAVSYPTDRKLGYAELAGFVTDALPRDGAFVILGESFGGPLSLLVAARRPPGLRAVVLCNTFIHSPAPMAYRWLPWRLLFRLRPPSFLIRWRLLGWDAQPAEKRVTEVRMALRFADPAVLANRVGETFEVDATDALKNCPCPVLYIHGDADKLLSRASEKRILTARPDVEARTLPGGHLLLQTDPATAWARISSFLKRH